MASRSAGCRRQRPAITSAYREARCIGCDARGSLPRGEWALGSSSISRTSTACPSLMLRWQVATAWSVRAGRTMAMPIKGVSKKKKTKVRGVYLLEEGRYLVRIRWKDAATGKRCKREVITKSIEDAVAIQSRRGKAVKAGRASVERLRLRDYAKQWLRERAVERAPSTRERYVGELANILTVLGDHFVDQLTESSILAWRREFSGTVAATTANAHLRTLRVVLEPLVRSGVLRRNPARDVESLREGRTRGRRGNALSAEELGRVIETTRALMGVEISEDVGRMILTLAWTGMRRGEMLGLKWEDCRRDELHLVRAWCKVTKSEKTLKTDDPRIVPMPEPLAEVLDEQRRWLVETQHPGLGSGLVFPADPAHAVIGAQRRGLDDQVSWYRSGSSLDRPIRIVAQAAGVPPISAHSFRRTYENLLRQAGVDELTRRSLAGWRTDKAQAIYANVSSGERADAAALMVMLVRPKVE